MMSVWVNMFFVKTLLWYHNMCNLFICVHACVCFLEERQTVRAREGKYAFSYRAFIFPLFSELANRISCSIKKNSIPV